MEEPLCCDCAPGKCPFIKIKDRTQPRKAHEDPLMSDLPSLLRPVAALSLCALAPLTTTHRQCLEKLGKRGSGAGALLPLCLRLPLYCIACIKSRDGPTAICTVPQAASCCCCACATTHFCPGWVGGWQKSGEPPWSSGPQTRKTREEKRVESVVISHAASRASAPYL